MKSQPHVEFKVGSIKHQVNEALAPVAPLVHPFLVKARTHQALIEIIRVGHRAWGTASLNHPVVRLWI